MKPKTHNKTKKIRGGRKQTGGFFDSLFGTPTTSDQPASSKPWWKFWESSTTPVVQEGSPTKTETGLPDPKYSLVDFNGGRRRKRRQKRTKKRSKSKSKSKAKTT